MQNYKLTLRFNDLEYSFNSPLTIFQAAQEVSLYIPRFCYHVALNISGNCRMCLVEEKTSLKPLASCAVTINTGMNIFTNTELVKRAREGVMEYLLINHPLDCPICDQGGECDLQDQSMVFGADRGRFYEKKRSTPNKNLGFLVKTFLNRCIHCARCTRFLHDLAGEPTISLLGRGYSTEISNYTNSFITSELSGNIIDLCPVGALTSKPYAFKARPWELSSVYTFDIIDPLGPAVQLDFRGLELLRILPVKNLYINDEWISDITRFYLDSLKMQRVSYCYFVNQGLFSKIHWKEALSIFLAYYSELTASFLPSFNFNLGPYNSLESLVSLKEFASSVCFLPDQNELPNDFRKNYSIRDLSYTSLEESFNSFKSFILFFLNLRYVSPLLNLRLRLAQVERSTKIYLIGSLWDCNFEFIHLNQFISNKDRRMLSLTKYFSLHVKDLEDFSASSGTVQTSVTDLASYEVNSFGSSVVSNTLPYFAFHLGQKEQTLILPDSAIGFSLFFLHQVEDLFLRSNLINFNLILPTTFYYEKVATYFTNLSKFFKTTTHYNFTLPNTKSEHSILNIILSLMVNSFKSNLNKHYFSSFSSFFCVNTTDNKLGIFIAKSKNLISPESFYSSTSVLRLSATLQLCSALYTKKKDFIS